MPHFTPEVREPNLYGPQNTERWTSMAFQVQFEQIQHIQNDIDADAFRLSAWGISRDLRNLLAAYTDRQITTATMYLTAQQNPIVANILEHVTREARHHNRSLDPVENLFITVGGELFLPHGMRMPVACVTNIVPNGEYEDGIDKFVAVLDPAEVPTYIYERKVVSHYNHNEIVH